MIKVKQFEFSYFGVNTYLVIDEATKEAAVIDPAMMKPVEEKEFDDYVEQNGIKVTQIINTHLHLDHCFGVSHVKDKYGVPVKAHADDAFLGSDMARQFQMFRLRNPKPDVTIDVKLKGGDEVQIGESRLQVIHVPGHSPGGIALYSPEARLLFAGDTLFRGSVGRTDLPGGDYDTLADSIRNKLYTLPDDVNVLPGHDRFTTIGTEKATNRYV